MAMSSIFNPLDGSFVKVTRKNGNGIYTPTEGSTCSVILNLANHDLFRPADVGLVTGEETNFTIGEGDSDIHDVIDKCLISMKENEVCGLMFPMSNGNVVEGTETNGNNTFVTIEIHLLNFTRVPVYQMDELTKLENGQRLKEKGSELFKNGRKATAFKRYSQAMKYIVSAGPEVFLPQELKEQYRILKTQVHLNLAACQLHYENYPAVIKNCTCAVDVDLCNLKGFYRRGIAFSRLKEWEKAESDLKTVINLDPGNKAALRELNTVHHMLQEEREAEKVGQLARGMRQMFN